MREIIKMKGTVLAIDDETASLKFIESALSKDYTILKAENGKQGLEKISLKLPDIILLDLNMPEMGGIEFLEKAQSTLKNHFIPVIMITGYPNEEQQIKAFSLGCYDFIGKPISLLELKLKVEKFLHIKRQVEKQIREKEVLLREIHHRVKNNMQIISSLLRLQSRYTKDKQILDIFKASQNRIESMAFIHEKLYQSKDLTRVDFTDYVNTLTRNLFTTYGVSTARIKLNIDIKNVSLPLDKAIPCGLIINELVSNSLKHAFPPDKEGEIKIALHLSNGNKWQLIVSDNGVGIPEDIDFRNTKSLGLHLVTILAEDQLRGEINLNRTEGTEFKIRFKELNK